jgi:hypothetical protein
MTDECWCVCHGSGAAFRRPCDIAGGCGHLHANDQIGCVLCPAGSEPQEATIGRVCKRCHRRLDERLADISVLYDCLPDLLIPGAGAQDTGRRGKRAAAPLPTRVDVLNLLGPANDVHIPLSLDALGDLECQQDGTPTRVALDDLVETVREQLGLPPGGVGQSVWVLTQFLRRQLDRICAVYEPLDDFVAIVGDTHNALRTVCGEHRPKPIGTCPEEVERDGEKVECGTPLFASTYSDTIRCRGCDRKWERSEWRWMGRRVGILAS